MRTKKRQMPETYEPGDLNFHYNREEREALLSDDTKRILTKKSKFFSLNKRNLIILADILFIIVVSIIFVPLSVNGRKTAKIEEFKANLSAYEYNEKILVSLKVYAIEKEPSTGIVQAVFSIDGKKLVTDMDILPSKLNEQRILRAEFPNKINTEKKVSCQLDINGKKKTLTTKVKKE